MSLWRRMFGKGEKPDRRQTSRAGGEAEPAEVGSVGPAGSALDKAAEKGYVEPSAGGDAAAREQQIAARRRNQ